MARALVLLCALAVISAASGRLLLQESPVPVESSPVLPMESPVMPMESPTMGMEASPEPMMGMSPAPADNATTGVAPTAPELPAGGNVSFPTWADALEFAGMANLTVLGAALNATGIAAKMNTTTKWTIFAPTDDAFNATLTALNLTADELLANTTLLAAILEYHVVPEGAFTAGNLTDGMNVTTALINAGNLTIGVPGNGTVNITAYNGTMANVTVPDVMIGASVVHIIDAVLIPPPNASINTTNLEDIIAPANTTDAANMTSPEPMAGAAGAMPMEETSPMPMESPMPMDAASPAPVDPAASSSLEDQAINAVNSASPAP